MIEKHSCYHFSLTWHEVPGPVMGNTCDWVKGWYFMIFDPDYNLVDNVILEEGGEYLDTEEEARDAAINAIDLLENGESIHGYN